MTLGQGPIGITKRKQSMIKCRGFETNRFDVRRTADQSDVTGAIFLLKAWTQSYENGQLYPFNSASLGQENLLAPGGR